MEAQKNGADTSIVLIICGIIGVLFILPAWYASHAGSVNSHILALAKVQLLAFSVVSDEAREAIQLIAKQNPAELSWDKVLTVLEYSGKWIRWPYMVILVMLAAVGVLMSRTLRLHRRMSMERLLQNNEAFYPCLHPIVGRSKELLSTKSYDAGLWRIARTPAQFAVENELLTNEDDGTPFTFEQAFINGLPKTTNGAYGHARLDESKTVKVFEAQLSQKFGGFETLTPARQVIAAAFLAYGAGDKKLCLHLLDTVSLSYVENDGAADCPVFNDAAFIKQVSDTWSKHQTKFEQSPLIKRHITYEITTLMALLYFARNKGVLAASQFLWLRPVDRPLWYALQQCGGSVAWTEALVPWLHYLSEEKHGKTQEDIPVKLALERLRESLNEQGWFTQRELVFGSSASCIPPEATMNLKREVAAVTNTSASEEEITGEEVP